MIPALHDAIPVVCVICIVCNGGNLDLNDTVLAPSGSNKIPHKNIPKVNLNSHLHIEAFTKMFFCIFYQMNVYFYEKYTGGEHQDLSITYNRGPVAQWLEHLAVTREVVSTPPAGPTLRVLK